MFGNKYQGDDLAKEFYKLVTLKKMASDSVDDFQGETSGVDSLENHVEDDILDPARFLNSVDKESDLTDELNQDVESLDSLLEGEAPVESGLDLEESEPMYSDDLGFLLDQRASMVLEGLGKIAGSLKQRGEGFAADIVAATAQSIKGDMVKEASRKLETITILSKVASDISDEGDQFAADMVRATISKIKEKQA